MPNYYLDIETTGTDPSKSKIITIQFQELMRGSGSPAGNLTILKEWETEEKEILLKFYERLNESKNYHFSFVPVGFNLSFEREFLIDKAESYGIEAIDLYDLPFIDLSHVGVLMNKGEFKGSGLDKLTGKPHDGSIIPTWYEEHNYGEIVNYVKNEAAEFIKFFKWLHRELPKLAEEYKQVIGKVTAPTR